MEKSFSELSVGDRFTLNGQVWVKIQDVRVSCCRSINCQLLDDANNRTYIQPTTKVIVNA